MAARQARRHRLDPNVILDMAFWIFVAGLVGARLFYCIQYWGHGINSLLDDRVRPALAGDGGGLQVMGLEGKTLFIRYQGACGSCPSSTAGTLMAIQRLLQSEVDEELVVTMS